MAEYIKRDEVIAALDEFRLNETVSKYATVMQCRAARDAISRATKALDSLPAADVITVVRCRECKYWGDEDGKLQDSDGVLFARCKVHNYLIDGRHTGWCPTENDFCSYGERKDGDGDG